MEKKDSEKPDNIDAKFDELRIFIQLQLQEFYEKVYKDISGLKSSLWPEIANEIKTGMNRHTADAHRLHDETLRQYYRQIEDLFSLFSLIKLNHPLPPFRTPNLGWAISPGFANILVSLISSRKPKLIVETGSGVSTLIAGYCMKEIGEGGLLSLEHLEEVSITSRNNLEKHLLSDFADVIFAPLKEVMIKDKKWVWYDSRFLSAIKSADMCAIDMLIVDGPPAHVQPLARYPALPLMFEYLADDAVVILDDSDRDDERKIIEMWLDEYKCFRVERIDIEKGATLLYKTE